MSGNANIVHLTEERFMELARAAADQNKSPDELADEAIALLLRTQRVEEVMEFGRRHTRELGIPESQVERLISEVRADRRSREQ